MCSIKTDNKSDGVSSSSVTGLARWLYASTRIARHMLACGVIVIMVTVLYRLVTDGSSRACLSWWVTGPAGHVVGMIALVPLFLFFLAMLVMSPMAAGDGSSKGRIWAVAFVIIAVTGMVACAGGFIWLLVTLLS